MNPVINLLAYQLHWLALVLGAARGLDWLGVSLVLAWLPVHARLSDAPGRDLRLLAGLVLLGPLFDTALSQAGLIRFAGRTPIDGYAPFWIIALWAAFALVLRHSLRWVLQRPLVSVAFGAAGGPLAYWGGARLGAAEFVAPAWQALLVLASGWAVIMLTLARLQRQQHDLRRQT